MATYYEVLDGDDGCVMDRFAKEEDARAYVKTFNLQYAQVEEVDVRERFNPTDYRWWYVTIDHNGTVNARRETEERMTERVWSEASWLLRASRGRRWYGFVSADNPKDAADRLRTLAVEEIIRGRQ